MFSEETKIKGHIVVYKVNNNDERTKMYEHSNTIHVNMYGGFRNGLVNRSYDVSVDYMCWGTYDDTLSEFLEGTYAGTGAAGTNTKLTMVTVGSISSKFTGTFGFLATKNINYFQLGRGFTGPPALCTTILAYDSSLLTGSTWVTYLNGETMIIDWTITVGT